MLAPPLRALASARRNATAAVASWFLSFLQQGRRQPHRGRRPATPVRIGVDESQDKQKGEKGRRRCSAGHGTRCDDGAPRGWRIGAHRDGAA